MCLDQGFFSVFCKKLKLKEFFAKTQAKNSKKPESSTQKRGKNKHFLRKTHIFLEKLAFFSKNSRISWKTQAKFSKNSRNRKVNLPSLPKKRWKKTPGILRHMNCLGCFTSPRGSFEPTTYSYKLYCTPSALSITPRVFHWDTNIEKYMFSECYATWVCGSNISILSWLQFHIFWDAKRVFLGVQCVFFWAICQTCLSGIPMKVFSWW